MHFSRKVPTVTMERRMNLADVIAARQACQPRPTWSAIFIKAFALVAQRRPELRQCYKSFPWPRVYEHPHSICTAAVERDIGDQQVVIYALLPKPDQLSLRELDAQLRFYKEAPLDDIPSVRTARRLARVPWPFRRWVWWTGLNVHGGLRSHHFGTFGTTTVSAHGAGVAQLIPLLASTFYYNMFDEAGNIDMRLAFDHRIYDGAPAARALVDMEETLHRDILAELHDLCPAASGARSDAAQVPAQPDVSVQSDQGQPRNGLSASGPAINGKHRGDEEERRSHVPPGDERHNPTLIGEGPEKLHRPGSHVRVP